MNFSSAIYLVVCIYFSANHLVSASVTLSEDDIEFEIGENITISVNDIPLGDVINIEDNSTRPIAIFHPDHVTSNSSSVVFTAQSPGHGKFQFIANDSLIYLHLTVFNSRDWDVFSEVIGWLYFVAWSISFYPQMYDNWKRKSVVGLNFDFLALNLVGFSLYSLYNAGLYWIDDMRELYLEEKPGGLIPVMMNDIVFAFHALFAVILTIVQCFIYEKADQNVSKVTKGIFGIIAVFLLVIIIISACQVITWLDFLNYCSYVKLSITLIKYIPQAYMNFRRKSTSGWSIGNVLLDFTGGLLSMLQMLVNGWNFDDWDSIFGDLTKFGLGLFSVVFDIFFLVQHYILYRHSYDDFPESATTSRSELAEPPVHVTGLYQRDHSSIAQA